MGSSQVRSNINIALNVEKAPDAQKKIKIVQKAVDQFATNVKKSATSISSSNITKGIDALQKHSDGLRATLKKLKTQTNAGKQAMLGLANNKQVVSAIKALKMELNATDRSLTKLRKNAKKPMSINVIKPTETGKGAPPLINRQANLGGMTSALMKNTKAYASNTRAAIRNAINNNRVVKAVRKVTAWYKKATGSAMGMAAAVDKGSFSLLAMTVRSLYLVGVLGLVFNAITVFKMGVQEAFMSVEEFKIGVASLTALSLSFMDVAKEGAKGDVASPYLKASIYASKLYVELERIAAITLLSGNETNLLANAFLRNGVRINTQSKEQMKAFQAIANSVALITAGQNREIQISSEINNLLTGRIRANDRLGLILKTMDPQIKNHMKLWKQQGTAIENIAKLLKGFPATAKSLEETWEAIYTMLQTTVSQVLRGGMKEAYNDILGLAQDIDGWLNKHKKTLQIDVLNAYKWIKKNVKEIAGFIMSIVNGVKQIGVTMGSIKILLGGMVFTKMITGLFSTKAAAAALRLEIQAMGVATTNTQILAMNSTKLRLANMTKFISKARLMAAAVRLIKFGWIGVAVAAIWGGIKLYEAYLDKQKWEARAEEVGYASGEKITGAMLKKFKETDKLAKKMATNILPENIKLGLELGAVVEVDIGEDSMDGVIDTTRELTTVYQKMWEAINSTTASERDTLAKLWQDNFTTAPSAPTIENVAKGGFGGLDSFNMEDDGGALSQMDFFNKENITKKIQEMIPSLKESRATVMRIMAIDKDFQLMDIQIQKSFFKRLKEMVDGGMNFRLAIETLMKDTEFSMITSGEEEKMKKQLNKFWKMVRGITDSEKDKLIAKAANKKEDLQAAFDMLPQNEQTRLMSTLSDSFRALDVRLQNGLTKMKQTFENNAINIGEAIFSARENAGSTARAVDKKFDDIRQRIEKNLEKVKRDFGEDSVEFLIETKRAEHQLDMLPIFTERALEKVRKKARKGIRDINKEIAELGAGDLMKNTRTSALDEVRETSEGIKEQIEDKMSAMVDKTGEKYQAYLDMIADLAEATKDRLKEVNESFKTEIADELAATAELIQESVNNIEIPSTNFAFGDDDRARDNVMGDGLMEFGGGLGDLANTFNPSSEENVEQAKNEENAMLLAQKLETEMNSQIQHKANLAQLELDHMVKVQEMAAETDAAKKALAEEELNNHQAKLDEEFNQIQTNEDNIKSLKEDGAAADAKVTAGEQNTKTQMWGAGFKAIGGLMKGFGALMGGEGKKQFKMMQALRIGEAVINGVAAAIAAWKSGMEAAPAPYNIALAAAMTAASIAQTAGMISKIASAKPGSSSQGVSASGSAPAMPTIPEAEAPAQDEGRNQSVNIHIYGNIVDQDTFARDLVPSIQKAILDGEELDI